MALSFHEGGRLKQDINLMRYPIGADGKLHEGDDGALYFRVSREYGTAHSKVSSSVGHRAVRTALRVRRSSRPRTICSSIPITLDLPMANMASAMR